MFDYHAHSTISFDGRSTMKEMAQAARQKGIAEICFTEHYDLSFPHEDDPQDCDFDLYKDTLKQTRASMPEYPIKFGVELGLTPEDLPALRDIVHNHPFDFVIASHHMLDGKDPYYEGFFDGRTVREGQRGYLQEIYDTLKEFDDYDVVGHIGYPDKYLKKNGIDPAVNPPFEYRDFPSLIDDILRLVIRQGKGIEANTSTYALYGRPMPHPTIIRRYAELGGRIITTGSDSHHADQVGRSFNDAYPLLLQCGLEYVCTFENREPAFHKIAQS
ncbi:histidinol-phosphatase HisJ family protein [Christensenellaceae bacterium OttesenSCG-928-K19]|nr:histidinol-phosphatase HisJ family protein [Christensenellaceae bacterium OttesenSCG-928-K19]